MANEFDPDKVKRWDVGTNCKSWMENVVNRSEVDLQDDTYVRSEDYDTLLKLYRELDAANANLKFEEVADSAVNDELAREIKQLKGNK
jgi:hypothetical protein